MAVSFVQQWNLGTFIILGRVTTWWDTPLFKIGFFTNSHADLCCSNASLAIPSWSAPEERQGCDVKSSCVLWLRTVHLAVCLSKMNLVLSPCLSGEKQCFLRALQMFVITNQVGWKTNGKVPQEMSENGVVWCLQMCPWHGEPCSSLLGTECPCPGIFLLILVTEKQQQLLGAQRNSCKPESPMEMGWDRNDLSWKGVKGSCCEDSREGRKWCPEPVPCGSEVSGDQEPGGREDLTQPFLQPPG